jgi:hypothetical protein
VLMESRRKVWETTEYLIQRGRGIRPDEAPATTAQRFSMTSRAWQVLIPSPFRQVAAGKDERKL